MSLPEEMKIALLDADIKVGPINSLEEFKIYHPGANALQAVLPPVDCYPYQLFDINYHQAVLMDRQLWQLVMIGYSLLHRQSWLLTKKGEIGLFVSAASSEYLTEILGDLAQNRPQDIQEVLALNDPTSYATRLAYMLDITGPAITTNSGCAGGATALHLAMNSLVAGQCNYALVLASGTGNSVTGLLLSLESQCGSCITLASLFGSGQSSDGRNKVSYGAPSVAAMVVAGRQALAAAEIESHEVQAVIAAGSDTVLGRDLENRALQIIYEQDIPKICGREYFGNLGPASSLANLIYFLRVREQWPSGFYGLNSFGLGGNNLHFIINISATQRESWPKPDNYSCLQSTEKPCYYQCLAAGQQVGKDDLDQASIIDREFSEILDTPLTKAVWDSTLSELGLDSYVTLMLLQRLEIVLKRKLPQAAFKPTMTLFSLKNRLLEPITILQVDEEVPKAKYKLLGPADYQEWVDLFDKSSLTEKYKFPQPLRYRSRQIDKRAYELMLSTEKMLLLGVYTSADELIGLSCYAENQSQLIYYGGDFKINPPTIQDFHYLVPKWRGQLLTFPELGPFLQQEGLKPQIIRNRQRSTGLIVSPEVHHLQARLLASTISDNYEQEEEYYRHLVDNDGVMNPLINNFLDNKVWQQRYFSYIVGNKFQGTAIEELLQITNDYHQLNKLKPLMNDEYIFTLTAARERVRTGRQVYAGLSFIHFEPFFLGDIDF